MENNRWPIVGLVLMSAYPFVQMTANNLGHTIRVDIVSFWIAAVVGVGLGVVALLEWLVRGSAGRVATFLIPWVFLTFNFDLFENYREPHILWLGSMAAMGIVMVFASRSKWTGLGFTLWAGLLFVVAVIQLATYSPPVLASGRAALLPDIDTRPDVWVFIPDGYTSASEVQRQAGVDISGFQAALHDRGFTTPDGLASFPLTYLSVASMLDQEYLVSEGDDVQERRPFYDRLQGDNLTVEQFRAWGYTFVATHSGMWEGMYCSDIPEKCISGEVMDRTHGVLLSRTPFEALIDVTGDIIEVAHYSNPAYVVARVLEEKPESPFLVVSHLMQPHPPSYWTADCEIKLDAPLKFHSAQWDRSGFADSVQCLNRQLLEAVDTILDRDSEAVIVIQADHGTHKDLIYNPAPAHRFDVLSALRLDCEVPEVLPVVNVMRIVTACLAGQQPRLLDYEAYDVPFFMVQSRG